MVQTIPLDPEPIHQHASEILACRQPSDETESRLALERLHQPVERVLDGRLAEVAQARTAARDGEQVRRVEPDPLPAGSVEDARAAQHETEPRAVPQPCRAKHLASPHPAKPLWCRHDSIRCAAPATRRLAALAAIGYKAIGLHEVMVVSGRAARLRHGTALLPRRSDRAGVGPGIVPGTLLAPRARRFLPVRGLQALRHPGLALRVSDRSPAVLEARLDLARRAGRDADHADRYPRRGRARSVDAAGRGGPSAELTSA